MATKRRDNRIKNRALQWLWLVTVLLFLAVAFLIGRNIWKAHKAQEAEEAWESQAEAGLSEIPVYAPDEPSQSIADAAPGCIPEFAGEAVVELNNGRPCFTEYDMENITGEHYSDLDELGRCGTAVAMLEKAMMPTQERGPIGDVRPTGWQLAKYPGLVDSDPPYLYNRCHLIAFAMTGQNANERNLITGTRYMNAETMLPYEERVLRCLDHSDGHVLYRVTPFFKGTELVARGVEIEAFSVEDAGAGVCFHVFLYNIQPGVEIDYLTGENRESE